MTKENIAFRAICSVVLMFSQINSQAKSLTLNLIFKSVKQTTKKQLIDTNFL